MSFALRAAGAMLLIALAACGGSDDGGGGPTPGPDAAVVISQAGGDLQVAATGSDLPVPLTARVTDSTGQPIPGVTVRWRVTVGDGAVASGTTPTDADGRASTGYRVGTAGGNEEVTAEVLDGTAVIGTPARFSARGIGGGPIVLVRDEPIPANYGIHDTFVRDGIAFVAAWNTGLVIYDVGNGMKGGSPSRPVVIAGITPGTGPSGVTGAIHNSWWFHNAATGEKRYLFVGQEGPGSIGSSSRGDIYVIDVSDLTHPQQVATFSLPGAGTHNFWVDETAQVLYAAYYNGGVVALDVSGTLSGDLAPRLLANVRPGGDANTYVWGVQVHRGSLYAIDMESGLWELAPASGALATRAGGFNVPERWSSDLWLHGDYAYTGTWGGTARAGNVGDQLKIWSLASGLGAPVNTITLPEVGTVSDVEVSADGRMLLLTTERGPRQGIYLYSLGNPANPTGAGSLLVANGLHTGTFAEIGGRLFVFAARNPGSPGLEVYDVTGAVP
ncbi:MAG: Ig-like domain-containing protein [Gemmatimonadales bacterium]